jgi:hypothetical protein
MKPTAAKTETVFRMECGVTVQINARPERVWDLLTNADDMPRWNSTVTSVRGPIALGTKLELRVPLAPERVFRPKVTALDTSARRMVWSDGAAPMFKGERTYTLTPRSDGTTEFSMVEVFRGVMLPMIKRSLPDFGPAFETYAEDLKREAERAA